MIAFVPKAKTGTRGRLPCASKKRNGCLRRFDTKSEKGAGHFCFERAYSERGPGTSKKHACHTSFLQEERQKRVRAPCLVESAVMGREVVVPCLRIFTAEGRAPWSLRLIQMQREERTASLCLEVKRKTLFISNLDNKGKCAPRL